MPRTPVSKRSRLDHQTSLSTLRVREKQNAFVRSQYSSKYFCSKLSRIYEETGTGFGTRIQRSGVQPAAGRPPHAPEHQLH